MRLYPVVLMALLAPLPALAQTRSLAPAASVLFRSAVDTTSADTVKVDTGIPQAAGRMIGLIGGATVGYLFTRIIADGPTAYACAESCSPPYNPVGRRVVSATIFGLLGFWIGGELTGPKAPKS